MPIQRPVIAVNTSTQLDLFPGGGFLPPEAEKREPSGGVSFKRPDPRKVFVCGVRLDDYLAEMGVGDALAIRELLQMQDWGPFAARYQGGGRSPYAPEAMLGLILYGTMKGVSSLRGLEELARLDLGCLWITGGLCPDHASIGRFIQMHEESLTGDFHTELTRTVLTVTGSGVATVAGDGTVVQAAASNYHTIKREAARQAAAQAREAAQAEPENPVLRARAERTEEVHATLEERTTARQAKGKSADGLSISPVEPEAVVQPQKNKKVFAPSYKPSVLANEARIIVAWELDPSQEASVVPDLLDQAASLGTVETALFDAGYHAESVITATAERDIELLCPSGRTLAGEDQTPAIDKPYSKHQFTYDAVSDNYRCPAGEQLTPSGGECGKTPRQTYRRYRTGACANCEQRPRCTTSKHGRTLKRYRSDGAKAALRQTMADPKNQERYHQRQAMVEPVFSVLRLKQGWNRFRRRGLRRVRSEFALHVMAYNLGRALVRKPARALFAVLWRALWRRIHGFRRWLRVQLTHPDRMPRFSNPASRLPSAVLGGHS